MLSIVLQLDAKIFHVTQKPLAGIPLNAQVVTISQATAQVGPSDIVMVHGGFYREEHGLSLEDLNLKLRSNFCCPNPGQGLFNWGVTWKKHKRYDSLDDVRTELSLAQGCIVAKLCVEAYSALYLRVPAGSLAVKMGCFVRRAGSPRLRLLFDIYHVQIMNGDCLCQAVATCTV